MLHISNETSKLVLKIAYVFLLENHYFSSTVLKLDKKRFFFFQKCHLLALQIMNCPYLIETYQNISMPSSKAVSFHLWFAATPILKGWGNFHLRKYFHIWAGCAKLKYLDLSDNKLTTLTKDNFGEISKESLEIDLYENPLRCDCSSASFRRWYDDVSFMFIFVFIKHVSNFFLYYACAGEIMIVKCLQAIQVFLENIGICTC